MKTVPSIEQRNEQLVRRFVAAYSEGRLDDALELVTEDYQSVDISDPTRTVVSGRTAFGNVLRSTRAALPDVQEELVGLVADERQVAFQIHARGHHTGGDWLGRRAAGALVEWDCFGIWSVRDGRLSGEVYLDDVPAIQRSLAGEPSTATSNKQLVRDYLAAFTAGDIDACLRMCRDDYVWQGSDPAGIGVASGKPAFRTAVESFKRALPDCAVEILDMVAEDDRVAVRFRESGHHTGEPWLGVEPAGAFVEWYPFAIYRVEDGLLAEEWFTDDPYAIKKCLGITTID